MKTSTKLSLLLAASLVAGCANMNAAREQDDGTYHIRRDALWVWESVESLRQEAMQEADRECSAQGERVIVVSEDGGRTTNIFLGNFAHFDLTFRCA